MSKTTAVAIAGICVLLFAIGGFINLPKPIGKSSFTPNESSEDTSSTPEETTPSPPNSAPAPSDPSSIVEAQQAELIERYGGHRVRHSRRIAAKIVTLNQRIAAADGDTNLRMRIISLMERDPSTLNPSDFDFEGTQAQEVTRVSSETLAQLQENPLPLQQILLIRDSLNRAELSETEYAERFTQLSKNIPEALIGITEESRSLEEAERHVEKLIKAIE